MSKRAHLSFGLMGSFLGLLCLSVAACGDDGGGSGETAGKGGSGGSSGETAGGGGAKAGTGGGTAGSKAGAGGAAAGSEEGDQCRSTSECQAGLSCVMAKVTGIPIRICARPCTSSDQCGADICASPYTGNAADAICINQEPAPFALCGAGVTAVCGSNRDCLYFQMSSVGVCVDLCQLDPTRDAGIGDEINATCPVAGQTCLSGIVDDGMQNLVGVCGTEVGRDAECGFDEGKLCKGTDICVPDDFNNKDSPQHCKEDCSTAGMCTGGGTCTVYKDIAYCKK